MRKYARLQNPVSITLGRDMFIVKKVLYYTSESAHYANDTTRDTFGIEFFSSSESVSSTEIEQRCAKEFNVALSDWVQIDDPMDFCNLDFIVPTRRKGRDTGTYWGDGIYE